MTAAGLLIVNADDWGIDRADTDAILRCFEAGAVTSASGMVFMADSQRASRLAAAGRLPIGLHINLTEAFTGSGVSSAVRRRQERIVDYFGGPKWRRWGLSPALFSEIELCISEQLAEFRSLYGREPSHFDGHQHIHQALGVLAARTIPTGAKMRPSLTFTPGEKWWANRAFRSLLNRTMRMRFTTPRYFFSIADMHPALGGSELEEKLALSGGSAVEVMTHPAWGDERAVLLDPSWTALICQRRTGSYEQL